MTKPQSFNTLARMRAVLSSRMLFELGAALQWERPVGRPPENPPYVVLGFGVLARLARSGIRVEQDLADPATWTYARTLLSNALRHHGLDLPPPGPKPPTFDHWRWMRDHHLATDAALAELSRLFPPLAVACANRTGLLLPDGPGSLTHPDKTRTVYGDGTQIRPIYVPPDAVILTNDDGTTSIGYPDPRTGQLLEAPPKRYDPDLVDHHGRTGAGQTHGYVCWHARGPEPYQRVVLAAAHIPEPGTEAATAVQLLGSVHRAAGPGIQAAVYDGAWRGVHIEEVMQRYGYLVLAKQPTNQPTDDQPAVAPMTVKANGKRARSYPLGPVVHQLPTGACVHQLATLAGRVVEIGLDETGDPVVLASLERGAVKRARRANGRYHFNVGFHVPCSTEPFTTWLSPHPDRDNDPRRPENLRVIAEGDPDFLRIRGLRSDAENFHANLKRTLLLDRAMSLGWRRGLVDIYCFALMNNSLAEAQALRTEHRPAVRHFPAARRA